MILNGGPLEEVDCFVYLGCSGGYHLERDPMPLHDAIGINRKKGATTETRSRCQVYELRSEYMLMIVCCYLTWHDYPSLVEGESHGILLQRKH